MTKNNLIRLSLLTLTLTSIGAYAQQAAGPQPSVSCTAKRYTTPPDDGGTFAPVTLTEDSSSTPGLKLLSYSWPQQNYVGLHIDTSIDGTPANPGYTLSINLQTPEMASAISVVSAPVAFDSQGQMTFKLVGPQMTAPVYQDGKISVPPFTVIEVSCTKR